MGKIQQRKVLLTFHRSPDTLGGVDGGWAEGGVRTGAGGGVRGELWMACEMKSKQ